MRSLSLRLLFGLCFSVVFNAYSTASELIYYTHSYTGVTRYTSFVSACWNGAYGSSRPSGVSLTVLPVNETTVTCKFTNAFASPPDTYRGSAYKVVIQCEYGSTGTACNDAPLLPTPDECLAAGPGIFSKSGPVVNSDGTNYVITAGGGTVCYGQCSHTLNDRAASCYSSGEGTGFCNYIGTPSGEACSDADAPLGTTGSPLNPPDTPDVPPSDPNDPGCPPGYGWSGTTCAKNPDDNGNPPGDGSGGDGGNGGDGGDTGGGDTGGGDTGGGGGDTGGGDTGGDTGGGDTGGGTGGGDTGGGTGTGDGTGEEGEDPVSSVGGESCSATITCEGDAIQCAILRSQKKQTCADEEARDYSKAAPTINAEIAKSEYQLKEETVDANGFFNMGTRFYSSTCPAPQSLHIETFGLTIQLSYQPLCDFAEALSYIVVAMASLFFMVYVGRSFGDE